MKTAVEWFAERIQSDKIFNFETVLSKAKEMEKQQQVYSEEDMSKSFFQGWVTRERFDDLSPDIIYPKGLDYEEKQEYAFNLWFEQFKKK